MKNSSIVCKKEGVTMKPNINLMLMDTLMCWDPLGYGEDAYETERVDVIQAVHELNDEKALAIKIQKIYEFSFEEMISMDECENKAIELLQIKNSEDACSI